MKNRVLSKCRIGLLTLLSSFLAAVCVAPSVPGRAATETELSKKAKVVAESEEVIMYYDEASAMISLQYKDSGRIVNTKVMDGKSGNKAYKNYQKSDVIVYYYKDTRSTSTTSVNNYEMAIESEQVEYEPIDQGIKVTYTLKENKLTLDVVPKFISQERMESMILPNLTTPEREWLSDYYRLYEGVYIRTKDSGVTQSVIKELQRLFYEVSGYTQSDLDTDNEENEYESTWSNLEIRLSVEYVLDGKDLLVKFPVSEYACNSEDSILNSVALLPYFLSSTTEEEGYIVVPDGSGAVIAFNNGMTKSADYVSRVFGEDILIDATKYDNTEYYANMPIIGMVYEDYAYLAVVEEGSSMAEIHTQISGKNDDYNKAYFQFYITEMENVATMENSAVKVNKYTGDTFQDKIVIRYRMLEDEAASYAGIAKAYQDYLINGGVLEKKESEEHASLFIEVLGATKESKNFLGIPYQGIRSLTSFVEVQEMMEYFAESGVNNLAVQLTGWANAGEKNTALTKLSIESSMGSKKELKSLIEYAKEQGFGFYPALNFQTVYAEDSALSKLSTSRFVGKYGAKFLSMEYAQLASGMLGLNHLRINSLSGYFVSANKLLSYVQKAVSKLEAFPLTGIAVLDIGTQLVPDYATKEPVSRETAIGLENAALGALAENYEVLLKHPYSYAWKEADLMTDLPDRSNEYNVFSYDIPLLQLVLDGCVSSATTPLNYDTQKDNNEMLLKCIETRMNPKFVLMQEDMKALTYTEEYFDLLSVNFDAWKERIVALYAEYDAFYRQVRDAEIINHETVRKNVVKVTYSNGVTVYVNYAKRAYMVDGKVIAASSYRIETN